jgi:hypothetical protein
LGSQAAAPSARARKCLSAACEQSRCISFGIIHLPTPEFDLQLLCLFPAGRATCLVRKPSRWHPPKVTLKTTNKYKTNALLM